MDCFYAQVEMRENPALTNSPIAVGGDSERGVLCTCNYIAREYGIRSAMSSRKAKQLCPELIILPSQMALYKSISQQIRQIFRQYTDLVEPLSLDEAYLDVTNCKMFGGSATLIAEDIRNQIFLVTGLTASAGVSVNKFIAKVASDVNKPNGLCVVPPSEVENFVHALPVKSIPGVGKVMAQKLSKLSVNYCADLLGYSDTELRCQFGKMGIILYQRIRGEDDRSVINCREVKSISVETTFERDIAQSELSPELLEPLVERLKARLAKAQMTVTKLQVKVKFADFTVRTKEIQFQHLDRNLFLTLSKELSDTRSRCKIRLLGIGVGVTKEPLKQLTLFEARKPVEV